METSLIRDSHILAVLVVVLGLLSERMQGVSPLGQT